MDFEKILIEKAESIIDELNAKGSIVGGKNGPYNDNETPLRVSAHWIVTLSWLYRKYGEEKYYNAIDNWVYENLSRSGFSVGSPEYKEQ